MLCLKKITKTILTNTILTPSKGLVFYFLPDKSAKIFIEAVLCTVLFSSPSHILYLRIFARFEWQKNLNIIISLTLSNREMKTSLKIFAFVVAI